MIDKTTIELLEAVPRYVRAVDTCIGASHCSGCGRSIRFIETIYVDGPSGLVYTECPTCGRSALIHGEKP